MKNSYYIIFTFTFLLLFVHIKTLVKDLGNFENKNSEITLSLGTNNITSLGQLRLSLYENSALANNQNAADGVLILFDTNGNNGVDANDAPDISNLDENFSTNNNGVLLSIESRAAPVDQEEIQLEVNTYRNTNYTIVAEGISMQNAIAFLYDNLTGISTEIPQNGIINYNYSINSGNPQSIANDRFKIVFDVETLSLDIGNLGGISLYPNPTDLGKFYVNVPEGIDDLKVTIYNVLGTELYFGSGYIGGTTITIDTDDNLNKAGTYFVEFNSQGRVMVKKLIVN
ncbi:MAG: hypothetical protein Tsb0033_22080 [Winogradskyella sp.]